MVSCSLVVAANGDDRVCVMRGVLGLSRKKSGCRMHGVVRSLSARLWGPPRCYIYGCPIEAAMQAVGKRRHMGCMSLMFSAGLVLV